MSQICVIVPVYNVEKYLHRCIDSILSQTIRDFELVLVDDGSLDGSGRICDKYAKKDSRIHVIHQKNGGLSEARNVGIDWSNRNSTSDWLTFVDSDDWIHSMYLEIMLRSALEGESEVVICGVQRTYGDPLPEIVDKTPVIWKTEDYYLDNNMNATVATGKLYKKTCFHNIRYPTGKIHEDEYVTYRILFRQKTVPVVEQPLYAYFQNDFGIMRKKWTPSRLDAFPALEQQMDFFEQRGYEEIVHRRFIFFVNTIEKNRKCVAESDLANREKRYYTTQLNRKLRRIIIRYRKKGWLPFWENNRNKMIYTNAFISIRVGRFIWGQLIKPVLKKVPGVRSSLRYIKKLFVKKK